MKSRLIIVCVSLLITVAISILFLTIGYNLGFDFGREFGNTIKATNVAQGGIFIGFVDNVAELNAGDTTRIVIAYNGWDLISEIRVIPARGLVFLKVEEAAQVITIDANRRYIDNIYYRLPDSGGDWLNFEFISGGRVLLSEVVNLAYGYK